MVSNSLDPGQARHFVWPDLGPNSLKKFSAADDKSCHKQQKSKMIWYDWKTVKSDVKRPNQLACYSKLLIFPKKYSYFGTCQRKIKDIAIYL